VESKLFSSEKRTNQKGQKIKFMAGNEYFADEIGTLKIKPSSEASHLSR
jgi:hypothetical protein